MLLLAGAVVYKLVKTLWEYRETRERIALMAEDRRIRQDAIQSHQSRLSAINIDLMSEIQRRHQQRFQ